MQFMAIFSYLPEDRDQVIERRTENLGKEVGVKPLGEWFDLSGHRVFRLFEADDETQLAAAVYTWSDIGAVEIVPVMETEKALKLLRRVKKLS